MDISPQSRRERKESNLPYFSPAPLQNKAFAVILLFDFITPLF
jgi:hypothetical protein